MFGVFALALAAGAWFMGAEKSVNHYTGMLLGKNLPSMTQNTENPTVSAPVASSPAAMTSQPGQQRASQNAPAPTTPPAQAKLISLDESKLQRLPGKALYKMSFEEVPVNNITTLLGRIVRLRDKDYKTIEGRVAAIANSSVFIQQTNSTGADLELPVANIKKLSLMVKKPLR